MGDVVLHIYLTVDGVMDGEGRASLMEWNPRYFTPEFLALVRDQVQKADALLLGRKVFEGFASSWPERQPATERSAWSVNDEIAAMLNALPKHVASRTLSGDLAWNGRVLEGEVPAAVAKLKGEVERDILVYGGGEFAHTLMQHDLIDEYRLVVFPIAVGKGDRLFKDDADLPLQLMSTRVLESGVIDLSYRRAAS